MARFRLFGRAQAPEPAEEGGSPPGPAYGVPAWPPGPPPIGAGAPPPVAGPATRSAQPARSARPGSADPPTDPHGFPPVLPPPTPSWLTSPRPVEMPDPGEAAALAGAFAVDYLSWDEEDPDRRGRVLRDYLAVPGNDPARLGWSGGGRQRAEFALPGRVTPDGDGRVLVDVRVRVTPYRAVGEREGPVVPEPDTEVNGVPAVAPAPTGRGWRSLASRWVRLSVPVVVENGRLTIDAWEETLGDEPPPPPAPPPADEHTLADDDDPLAEPDEPDEPRHGGAW